MLSSTFLQPYVYVWKVPNQVTCLHTYTHTQSYPSSKHNYPIDKKQGLIWAQRNKHKKTWMVKYCDEIFAICQL